MAERAEFLAKRFLQTNEEVLAVVEACSDDQWKMICVKEGESVGLVTYHIAGAYIVEMELMKASLTGQPVPDVYAVKGRLDQWHAEQKEQFQDCRQDETIALSRQNAASAANFIAGLSNDQLNCNVDAAQS
jgi:hypothetical protein